MSDLFGRPIVVVPFSQPGCWARLTSFALRWVGRLAWFGAGALVGYIVGVSW